MCSHAFIRTWADGAWWLACASCTYRIFESHPSYHWEAPHMNRTVEIKLHPELRQLSADPTPQTDIDKATWPLLDTAYQLLREAAVRAAFVEISRQAAEQGIEWSPSPEEHLADVPELESIMDLAPDDGNVAGVFHGLFEAFFSMAMLDAQAGLDV